MPKIETIKQAFEVEEILYDITSTHGGEWPRKITKYKTMLGVNYIIYEYDDGVDAHSEKEFIEWVNAWVDVLASSNYHTEELKEAGLI
jgi:hypothetical protein